MPKSRLRGLRGGCLGRPFLSKSVDSPLAKREVSGNEQEDCSLNSRIEGG